MNFSGWECSSFVESDEFWTLSGNSIKSIVNERVHDVHGFFWDTNVWVHLLKDFIDVNWEGLNSSSSGFLVRFWLCGSFFFSHSKFLFKYYIVKNCIEISSFNIHDIKIINYDWLNFYHKNLLKIFAILFVNNSKIKR